MPGAINGVGLSLLIDTGAVVTLLREDVWRRVTAAHPQDLKPWSAITLVSAGGTTITIHGCGLVELELKHKKYPMEIVVVSPLTSEGIIGLNFLQDQKAVIDLANRRLHFKEDEYSIPLGDLMPLQPAEPQVRATKTVIRRYW